MRSIDGAKAFDGRDLSVRSIETGGALARRKTGSFRELHGRWCKCGKWVKERGKGGCERLSDLTRRRGTGRRYPSATEHAKSYTI
eukprot:scaffold2248_cov261-Pinguiococcus_pyrenoidosus.AAC.3